MELKIKRFDKSIPLPAYQTDGAVGIDLAARLDADVPPRGRAIVPLNVAVELPRGHFGLMAARSSLGKRGLQLANGIGVFDQDFAGDNDEYTAILHNLTDEIIKVKKGDRITQLIVLSAQRAAIVEADSLASPDRGGMGSTGI